MASIFCGLSIQISNKLYSVNSLYDFLLNFHFSKEPKKGSFAEGKAKSYLKRDFVRLIPIVRKIVPTNMKNVPVIQPKIL